MSWVANAERFNSRNKPAAELLIRKVQLHRIPAGAEVDPITYEVLSHKLWQITDEIGTTIRKVSGSPIATEANDFVGVVTDEYGDVVYMGPYIIFHAGVMDLMIKWTLENRCENPGIHDGDMFLCNDPWVGAVHQNDVAVLCPIFHEGELFCWAGTTVHQVDVGGKNPGSFAIEADEVFGEVPPVPPIKIVKDFEIQRDVEDVYLRRSRQPQMVALDLRAKIAGNNVARMRIRELIARYGPVTVKTVMKRVMDQAELLFRDRLRSLPDGVWRHIDYQEVAKQDDRGIYKVSLTMTKQDDELRFDFTGSDKQVGMINSTYAGLRGGTMAAILPMLCYDIPWSLGGIYRAITFISELGTINNADFPAACSMGSIAGTWQTENCANMTIAKMLAAHEGLKRQLLSGCGGSWTTMDVMGWDQRGMAFVTQIMDCMAAGFGARCYRDGVNTGGHLSIPMGRMPNIEATELFYPILYLYRREETDSGGPGRYRGGLGATSCWILHDTTERLTHVLAAFGVAMPTCGGLSGGYPANAAMYRMCRESNIREWIARGELPRDISELEGRMEYLCPKTQVYQHDRDVYQCLWQGGGGYGDPLDREPEQVREDVLSGYVSARMAAEIYGVVIRREDGTLAPAETQTQREAIRRQRLNGRPLSGTSGRSEHIGGRQVRIDEHLSVTESGRVACTTCGHDLGPPQENYKLQLARRDRALTEICPLNRDPKTYIDEEVVFREYACPGCATLIETEIILKSLPPVFDKQLRV
jgi:N-methylhydantoinase B